MFGGIKKGALAIIVAGACILGTSAFAATIPSPVGAVNDYTNTLSQSQIAELNKGLKLLRDRKNSLQFVIAVVPNMQGEDIKPYANQMFHEWGIGKKGEDKGLLLVVAKTERKVRFETGYGLEGTLPDMVSAGIIRMFGPKLSAGDYFAAFNIAIKEIGLITNKN